jgi:hypothetical protein
MIENQCPILAKQYAENSAVDTGNHRLKLVHGVDILSCQVAYVGQNVIADEELSHDLKEITPEISKKLRFMFFHIVYRIL